MAAYTHVMLTGQNTEHIDTAIADFNFHPIKTVYLLHSPNEKKATGYKTKPTLFKDLAKKCKKRIEGNKSYNKKVKLVEISSAFDAEVTILAISQLFKDEIPYLATKKQFVVNVTGGTNMMAVGALIAAGIKQTSAYYVLDNRFHKDLDTYLKEIHIPDFKMSIELKESEEQVLYEISKSKFEWKRTPKNEVKKYDVDQNELSPNAPQWKTKITYKITDSLTAEWMSPKTIDGATTLQSQDKKDPNLPEQYKRNRGLQEIMEDDYGIKRTRLARILERLQNKGLVTLEKNVPKLSPPLGNEVNRWKEYRLDSKQILVTITKLGLTELEGFKPG